MTTFPDETLERTRHADDPNGSAPGSSGESSPIHEAIDAGVITVGIINDYEVVVRGVAAMLAPYSNRVRVVELETNGPPKVPADIALFDTFAGRRHTLTRAAEMVREGSARHVVLYTWDAAPPFLRAAEEIGVSGVILKTRSADLLVDSLERIMAGERVGFDVDPATRSGPRVRGARPDRQGPDERADRRGAVPVDRNGEDVREAVVRQARRAQPGPGGRRRLQPPADAP